MFLKEARMTNFPASQNPPEGPIWVCVFAFFDIANLREMGNNRTTADFKAIPLNPVPRGRSERPGLPKGRRLAPGQLPHGARGEVEDEEPRDRQPWWWLGSRVGFCGWAAVWA